MVAGGPLTDAFDGTSAASWALSNPNGDADSTATVAGGVLTLHFNGPPGCDLVHGDSNSPAYLQDVDDVDFDIRMRVNTALLGLGASGSGYVMVVLVAFNAAR
ncbi:MAG: hypothetical protein ACRDYU_03665, partial [Actinomycetes bacterium]